MFSNIGWVEIFFIVLLGLVIIGPERLPGVIKDVRAAIYAARKAINNARRELDGELEGLGQEFDSLRGPISTAAEWGRLGPRGAITKALFDGDESAWDDFNPTKKTGQQQQQNPGSQGGGVAQQYPQNPQQYTNQPPAAPGQVGSGYPQAQAPQAGGFDYSQIYAPQPQPNKAQPPASGGNQPESPSGRGLDDVT